MRRADVGARGARLAARVLTDALAEGTDAYWQRRAEAFEKALRSIAAEKATA